MKNLLTITEIDGVKSIECNCNIGDLSLILADWAVCDPKVADMLVKAASVAAAAEHSGKLLDKFIEYCNRAVVFRNVNPEMVLKN